MLNVFTVAIIDAKLSIADVSESHGYASANKGMFLALKSRHSRGKRESMKETEPLMRTFFIY